MQRDTESGGPPPDLALSPLTGTFGAEIVGAGGGGLDDHALGVLADAVTRHGVVVVRDVHLDPPALADATRRLGAPLRVPFIEPVAGTPEVIPVVREADEHDVANFGGVWHGDFTFLPEPPSLTLLHAVELPPVGGDTVFADLGAAFDRLPAALATSCLGLRGVHTGRHAFGPTMQPTLDRYASMRVRTSRRADDDVEHPLVTAHPVTGRPVLFFNPAYVRGVRRLEETTERRLIRFLAAHTTDHRITYRHRWRPGDLVVWDNRRTQHLAVDDYAGHRREMIRSAVAGPGPVAAQSAE